MVFVNRVATHGGSGASPGDPVLMYQKEEEHGEAEHPRIVVQRQDRRHHLPSTFRLLSIESGISRNIYKNMQLTLLALRTKRCENY